jgi:lipoate-protein ligase A
LNYALVLEIAGNTPLAGISTANRFIMERNRKAVQSAIGNQQSAIFIRGHTDLALNSQLSTLNKFSGNSQRRRKHFLLFHGTFLLNFNLSLISEFLRMPSKQPDYRENRPHAGFLTNLDVPAERIKAALRKAWNTEEPLEHPPLEKIAALAREKYSMPGWNLKF